LSELGIGIASEDHHVAGHEYLAKIKWARRPSLLDLRIWLGR
jgi:hypothetical protein